MASPWKWAKDYLEMGFHPIPCKPRTKLPLVKWKQYQNDPPTLATLLEWEKNWKEPNLALVLGRGAIAVDLDGGESAEALLRDRGIELPEDAPRNRTPNGFHVLLSVSEPIGDAVRLLSAPEGKPAVDIRGIGYIIVPPSIHPSGEAYRWLIPPANYKQLPAAPKALIDLIKSKGIEPTHEQAQPGQVIQRKAQGWVAEALRGVGEGRRNDTCAKLAGYFFGHGLDEKTVVSLLVGSFGPGCTPSMPEDEIEQVVLSVSRKASAKGQLTRSLQPISADEAGKKFLESLNAAPPAQAKTGFAELDKYLNGGLSPGELIYIGARPGVGKTALSLQMAMHSAQNKAGVLFVSREMGVVSLMRRLVAQHGKVSASELRYGRLRDLNRKKVEETVTALSALPVWFTDEVVSYQELLNMITEFRPEPPIGLLIVDYLQILRGSSNKEKRMQVEEVSSGLKTMALQFKIPVICMSSLSRKKNDDSRPGMDSLRESGELEHDADIIIMLHRELQSEEVECKIVKNREGRVGEIKLRFEPNFLTFVSDGEVREDKGFVPWQPEAKVPSHGYERIDRLAGNAYQRETEER